ncbi:hypothetical protein [Pelosinus sp. IPA-1]|uniref:hypothetical protein n=1 Tax=Pelosinus sp. IPA-1 TaxID=3029569 RepID=UPI0024362BB5|nr:hypothetical protein [Pelosinus sp. IPA-1]GMB00439.1 hypothetical protein PIPA1_32380 [Pelosinus sp. IPA-1]
MAKIYQIAFELAGKLGSNFSQTFLSAQKSIANVDGQIRKLTANQGKITQFDAMKRELVATEREYKAAQDKVKALANEMKTAETPTKALTRSFEQAKNEAAKMKDKVDQQQATLGKVRASLKEAGVATTDLAAQNRKLGQEIGRLNQQKSTYAALQAHADKFKASSVSAFKSVAGAATAATVALSGYYATALGFANGVMEKAAKARGANAKLGIGIEAYQELQYAAKMSNVAADDFDGCMKKMVVSLAKAENAFKEKKLGPKGNQEVIKEASGLNLALEQIGLSAQELSQIGPDRALMKIAGALSNVKDPAEKTRLAVALFGKEGLAMMPLLNQGEAGLASFREEAKKLGLVLDETTVKQAAAYGKVKKQFGNTVDGVKNIIGAAILPALTTGAQELTDLIKMNQGDVKQFASQFANGLKACIPYTIQFIKGAKEVAVVGIGIAKGLAYAVGGFDKLAWVLGAIIGIKAATAFYQMGQNMVAMGRDAVKLYSIMRNVSGATKLWAGAQAALNFIMAANPIALIVIGVVAIGAAIFYVVKHWDDFKGYIQRFCPWMISAVSTAVDAVLAAWEFFKSAGVAIFEAYVAYIKMAWGVVKSVLTGDWDGVLASVTVFVDNIKGIFAPFFNWVSDKWQSMKNAFSSMPTPTGGAPGIRMHADGGIFDRPHLGMVAEAGEEGIVPIKNRTRGLQVLAQVQKRLGVEPPVQPVQVMASKQGAAGSMQVTYAPNYQIIGADPEKVAEVARKDREDFEAQMERYEAQRARVAY